MVEYPGIGISRVEIHDDLFDFVVDAGTQMFVIPVRVAGIYSDIIDAVPQREYTRMEAVKCIISAGHHYGPWD